MSAPTGQSERNISEKSRKLARVTDEEADRLGDQTILKRVADALNIGRYKRHVLLCTGPDCCTPEQGVDAWGFLKGRLKELKLDKGENCVYRSKVGCLRICHKGPSCLVYPEGTWYHSADAEGLENIIQQHLIKGEIVENLLIAENPLSDERAG
jgi:(2Fe-2S) ferredoxin